MQKLNTQLLKKVRTKKVNTGQNILFFILSFFAMYGVFYALCMVLTLIDLLTL